MSNTRHIAAEPQDWQVHPRPPRPDPVPPDPPLPPPPPPEPPPPGVDLTGQYGAWVGIGWHGSRMLSGYNELIAAQFAITTTLSSGQEVIMDQRVLYRRGGIRTIYRDCPLNEEDEGTELPYVGGPNYPAPYGLNVPEGGRLILMNFGYKYLLSGWMTLAGYTISAHQTTALCPRIPPRFLRYNDTIGSERLAAVVGQVKGSGLFPRWTDYGLSSGETHYNSVRFTDDGWIGTKWNPPPRHQPRQEMPEHIRQELEWMQWLPMISVHDRDNPLF